MTGGNDAIADMESTHGPFQLSKSNIISFDDIVDHEVFFYLEPRRTHDVRELSVNCRAKIKSKGNCGGLFFSRQLRSFASGVVDETGARR